LSNAQDYKTAVGFKVGAPSVGALNIKHFLGSTPAIDISLGGGSNHIWLQGLYEINNQISDGFSWYYGGGAVIGFWSRGVSDTYNGKNYSGAWAGIGSGGESTGLTATAFNATSPISIATTSSSVTYSVGTGFTIPVTGSTTEWTTAFGWGNHADAGYLTGISGESIADLSDVDSIAGIVDGKILMKLYENYVLKMFKNVQLENYLKSYV
jgi:hypothetical protein